MTVNIGPQGLPLQEVVNVQVNLSPLAAQMRNFGAMMCVGPTDVIDVNERIREYTSLTAVANDFGTLAPEYEAAALHFGQSPQPSIYYVGRFAQTASHATLRCGVMAPGMQAIDNFTGISNGGFYVMLDGVPYAIASIDMVGGTVTNLNGVATLIQDAINAVYTPGGATVAWNAPDQQFVVESGTTGVTSTISYLNLPTAVGNFHYTGNMTDTSNTIVVNGDTWTYVSGTATGLQIYIGTDLPTTLTNTVAALNASTSANTQKMTYVTDGAAYVYAIAAAPGVDGDNLTLSVGGSNVAASGATLLGGNATDISTLIYGNEATAEAPADGIAAETPLACIELLDDLAGGLWYGSYFAATITNSDHTGVAGYIQGSPWSHVYGITTNDPQLFNAGSTTDIAASLQTLQYFRSFVQYAGSNDYAVASAFARCATINFSAQNSTMTLKFKQMIGVQGEYMTSSQQAILEGKNANVYVYYNVGLSNQAIEEQGVMSNGYFFDEVQNCDWLQNYIQINVWNVLYGALTKIPQTDPGIGTLVNACNFSMNMAVYNGMCAPGQWNVAGFGQLNQGDYLNEGYYCWVIPVRQQDQADREARKAPPIQVAAKLAGAVHFAYVIVTVNR